MEDAFIMSSAALSMQPHRQTSPHPSQISGRANSIDHQNQDLGRGTQEHWSYIFGLVFGIVHLFQAKHQQHMAPIKDISDFTEIYIHQLAMWNCIEIKPFLACIEEQQTSLQKHALISKCLLQKKRGMHSNSPWQHKIPLQVKTNTETIYMCAWMDLTQFPDGLNVIPKWIVNPSSFTAK